MTLRKMAAVGVALGALIIGANMTAHEAKAGTRISLSIGGARYLGGYTYSPYRYRAVAPYRVYGTPVYRAPVYHDTSHYDYHPPTIIRHGHHYHVTPGHYHYHRTGHWHH